MLSARASAQSCKADGLHTISVDALMHAGHSIFSPSLGHWWWHAWQYIGSWPCLAWSAIVPVVRPSTMRCINEKVSDQKVVKCQLYGLIEVVLMGTASDPAPAALDH